MFDVALSASLSELKKGVPPTACRFCNYLESKWPVSCRTYRRNNIDRLANYADSKSTVPAKMVPEAVRNDKGMSHVLADIKMLCRTAENVIESDLAKIKAQSARNPVDDLDLPISEQDRTKLATRFSSHYHMTLRATKTPSDVMLGRLYRERQSGAIAAIDSPRAKSLSGSQRTRGRKAQRGRRT